MIKREMVIERKGTTEAGLRAVCILYHWDFQSYRCGYVAVPVNHPLHGKKHDAPLLELAEMWTSVLTGTTGKRGAIPLLCFKPDEPPTLEVLIDVHGSITYSADHAGGDKSPSVDWWFGFDCAHDGDTLETCDTAYVQDECERLAVQLVEAGKAWVPVLEECTTE